MRLTTGDARGVRHAPSPPSSGPLTASAALAIGLFAVFVLDQATGSAPVQHLYYAPIVVAAIRFGFRGGLATSCAAIVLYHFANPRLLAFHHQQWDFVQVALFIAVGVLTAKLVNDNRRLDELANTDDLTGLLNLRSFERRLAAMVRTCRNQRVPLSVLVLDLDHLKKLNDSHGHLAGAEAVRTVGDVIAAQLPPAAIACRYGGDEFVIALPRCTDTIGRAFADGIRHAVHSTAPRLAGLTFPAGTLSVSGGVAAEAPGAPVTPSDRDAGEALFRAADRALYEAKALGRNHVCVA